MLEFLVDNIFVVFGGKVFQQIVGIPIGTNCAPLLADIFLYSYEAKLIQYLLSTGKKKIASRFNFTYRYINDVLSINNPDFENYPGQMYPVELEIKDTTESNTSVTWIFSCRSRETVSCANPFMTNVTISTSISNNFPFLSGNISSSPDPSGRTKCTPVIFLHRKMTRGRFSMGVVIRRYTGCSGGCSVVY